MITTEWLYHKSLWYFHLRLRMYIRNNHFDNTKSKISVKFLYHNLPSLWKHTNKKILLLLYCMGSYARCPKSAHIPNNFITQNATLFDAAFIQLAFFLPRTDQIQLSIIISNHYRKWPAKSSLSHYTFQGYSFSIEQGKARPNRDKQICLCGSPRTRIGSKKFSVFFTTLSQSVFSLMCPYTVGPCFHKLTAAEYSMNHSEPFSHSPWQ